MMVEVNYHVHVMSDAEYFTHCMEQRAQPINRLLNTALAKQIDENQQKVMSILKTHFLWAAKYPTSGTS